MMNLKSKRANLKKVLLESQIKFLKTQNNEMILNFQEAMKSKCSSQSCRLCKCTSSITKWVKTMNIGIVTLVLWVVEFTRALIKINRDVCQEMPLEVEVRFNKTLIQFSKRTKVVQVRSSDKICLIHPLEVHSEWTKLVWEINLKLEPQFQVK